MFPFLSAITSGALLHKGGRSRYPSLVFDIGGKYYMFIVKLNVIFKFGVYFIAWGSFLYSLFEQLADI